MRVRRNYQTVRIAKSTKDDLKQIIDWLFAEEMAWLESDGEYDTRGFLPNAGWICAGHVKENLTVLKTDGLVAGFLLSRPGLFRLVEVRPDMRGRGYGRQLVEFGLQQQRETGESIVRIEIETRRVIPFWEKMSFTIKDYGEGFRLLAADQEGDRVQNC